MADEPGDAGARPAEAPTPEGARPEGQADERREAAGGKDDAASLSDAGREVLDRERRARREAEKRATEAEHRLQSLQDEGKSELERAIARLDRQSAELESERATRATLESRLAESELLELKRQVASELGVPPEAAHRLQGDDVRSLKADAQRYLEERKPVEGKIGVGTGGAAAARAGADMNTLIREASGRN